MAQYTPSPHLVSELRPEGANGARGGTYQLNANSASPTVIVGRDDIGMPIEETLPHGPWREFVHPSGSLNRVPMFTSVGDSSLEFTRYGQQLEKELVQSGWIPSEMCPYSFEYKHFIGGSFVKVPKGEVDCGGSKSDGGCVHLQKVIEGRLASTLKKHEANQIALTSMKMPDVEKMMSAAVAAGIGMADPKAAKAANAARLRDEG